MRKPHLRITLAGQEIRYRFPLTLTVSPRYDHAKAQRFHFTERTLPEEDVAPAPAPHAHLPDIFVWGIIDWHFRFQRPQHLSMGLARRGHRVFYISAAIDVSETPGFSSEDLGNGVFSIRLRVRSPINIYADDPDGSDKDLRDSIGQLIRWAKPRSAVSIVQYPFWRRFADAIPNSILAADVLDFLGGFDNVGPEIAAEEQRLLLQSDLTVVSAQPLAEHVRDARNVAIVRNGADYLHFSEAPEHVFQDEDGRKIIGYYGAIASWFDTDIIARLAESFPNALILLIGQDSAGAAERLRAYTNVRFVGEVAYEWLPYYLHAFDVAIMPFKINALTNATNPVKVYEYLAAGKPVVATALPETAQFGRLIRPAVTPDAFVAETGVALAETPSTLDREQRRAFARANTWDDRVETFAAAIDRVPKTRISVVIVAYNQLSLTKQCLASIAGRSHHTALEIIVVDNASTDGTADFLRTWQEEGMGRTAWISPTNLGFAGGVNRGLAEASGDVLVIMNNDVIVTDGWIGTLAKHLRRDPQLGMVGPVTNSIGNEARIDIAYPSLEEMPASALAFTAPRMGRSFPIRNLAFFCVAMRRDVYEVVGTLDERFGQGYFEDDDYCRRIEAAGFSLRCAEDVFVHHEHSASFDLLGDARRKALFASNRIKYEEKWGAWNPHTHRPPSPPRTGVAPPSIP